MNGYELVVTVMWPCALLCSFRVDTESSQWQETFLVDAVSSRPTKLSRRLRVDALRDYRN